MNTDITWTTKPFEQLTPYELYAILQLRNEVFVVEQDCVYQDADNKDFSCHHLCAWQDGKLAAYARLVPPGLSYDEMSIGRVITSPHTRGTGLGKTLITEAIRGCHNLFGPAPIRISAQLYLQRFYSGFGFAATSDVYMEDNIPHIEMLLAHA